jgi:hypothetical protein
MRERVYWCIVESWTNGQGQPAELLRDRRYVNRWRRLDAALAVAARIAARIAANWGFLDDYAITVVEAVEGVNDEPHTGAA